MTLDAWLSVAVVFVTLVGLILTRIGADLILLAGLSTLLLTGVLTAPEALAGFANEGVITVGVLYVVVAGLQETGVLARLGQLMLGRPRSVVAAQARVMLPTVAMSAFLNNTPLVAMLIPTVTDWARKHQVAVSQLLIPLSYAAILGGTCSLIGTSTNLVVNGLLLSQTDLPPLGMFTIARVGLPSALVGVLYVLLVGRWLLPSRRPPVSRFDDVREYAMEMVVPAGSPLAARSIERAGLRHLQGAFLADLERDGRVLAAVSPDEVLRPGDRLRFVGVADAMLELRRSRGLVPSEEVEKLALTPGRRRLVEAVVSEHSPLAGRSIRDSGFRSLYNAVVIAVARGGERLGGKLGDLVLRPGDTLLIEAQPSFAVQQRNSRDFYLVSQLEDSAPFRHDRAPTALAILVGMIVTVTAGLLSMLQAALLAAGLMIVTRCLTGATARRSVDWSLLVVIAASFGLGRALELSGASTTVASALVGLAAGDPWLSLALVYAVTTLFTEVITNNGAAVLMFPIATATAASLGVSALPFAIAIMMAASASFATPIGYQTNLMVYGPGGYRFGDYLRLGVPLNLLMGVVSVSLIPRVWPF